MVSLKKLSLRRKKSEELRQSRQFGQSLVEMAVVAPVLLFIFLGLIEVGWAIRGYLVLLSTGRETARVASRGEYLDWADIVEGADAEDTYGIGTTVRYDEILTHTATLLNANNLGLTLGENNGDGPNGTFILTHYLVDSGEPCHLDPDPTVDDTCSDNHSVTNAPLCVDPDGNGICDCSSPEEREPDNPLDDKLLFPGRYGYEHFTYMSGITDTYVSRVVDWDMIAQLKEENDAINCLALSRSRNAEMSINSLIMVETFYDQSQLLGVPFLSNRVTDPVPLYSQTSMRIGPSELSQGDACELMPIGIQTGFSQSSTFAGQSVDWLRWTNGQSNAADGDPTTDLPDSISSNTDDYFMAALRNRRLVLNDFVPNVPRRVDNWLAKMKL
ncbi:MAG: TadE family protein [Chloroflexota bacterium]